MLFLEGAATGLAAFLAGDFLGAGFAGAAFFTGAAGFFLRELLSLRGLLEPA